MIDDLAALRLQLDWGADETLGDEPVDRLVQARPTLRVPAVAAQAAAPIMIADPDTLDALHAALDRLTTCPLRATATHTVRPSGNPTASVVLIADAPGRDDDRSGQAFSGVDGALFDRVIGSAGLTRGDMLLTTLVPWRPPGGRPASDSEVQACLPYIRRLLALVRPRLVVLAGAGPVAALTGQTGSIRQLRGRSLELAVPIEQSTVTVIPILPLAQWLRDAATKQQVWSDLLRVRSMVTLA